MSNHKEPDLQHSESRDEVEVRRVLRAAGRRPAPPQEDLEKINAAARGAWQQMTQERQEQQRSRFQRPTRRVLALAASLVIAALAGFWWLQAERQPVAREIVASVERVSGVVLMGEEAVAVAAEVIAGAELSTVTDDGTTSRLALRMADGQSLRLDENTAVRMISTSSLELIRGAVYIDSPPSEMADRHLDVVTGLGTVVEIGTQFEVRLDDGAGVLDVRVREGAVSVRHEGRSVTARLGEGLTVRRDGSVSRRSIATAAAEWQWVLEVAPAYAIDGQALDVVLAGNAREMGWEVVYATEELQRAASSIAVHSIEGLRPDQSIDVALRGTGLEYEVVDATLRVSRP